MKQIICKDLTLKYDSRTIVENLSFDVEQGDYLCIVGENGSGKTTLMRTLLGLHAPAVGLFQLEGGVTHKDIGYLPQQTDVQKDFPASVREIVLSGCQGRVGLRPWYSKEEKALANANMKKMGISALSNRCYSELSGGQQQRVLLARALCAAGKVLLLDEPVTGLDPGATAEMYSLVSNLNKSGLTVIMISHDVKQAIIHASHILDLGKNHFFGTKAEYVEQKTEIMCSVARRDDA